jgi:outer membrane protein, heavy metal efflux system
VREYSRRLHWILLVIEFAGGFAGGFASRAWAQAPLTWIEVRDRFISTNPTLIAGRIGIEESRAEEITAYLRPNPDFTGSVDQINPFSTQPPPTGGPNVYSPFAYAEPGFSFDYLHERRHKRELRRDSARQATDIAVSQLDDQQRTLLFNLRSAFVQTLQQKATLDLARENLAYYDRVLQVSRGRRQLGDIAQIDLNRLELQRVQYETDIQTAIVALRTAKIQLLMLLNDRTPTDRFDVTGPYDFPERIASLEEYRKQALDTRPDLRAAVQSIEKAHTDHRLAEANGSTDPTFSVDFGRDPPIPVLMGVSVSIPLRIFDRNQGEKARTQLDIGRNERLRDATQAQVFNDVDSAHAAIESNLILLKSYKENYLEQAVHVRDTVLASYQLGGASLLDFLQAQQDYRAVRLNYVTLIGSYLTAAAQLNLAVGREALL